MHYSLTPLTVWHLEGSYEILGCKTSDKTPILAATAEDSWMWFQDLSTAGSKEKHILLKKAVNTAD